MIDLDHIRTLLADLVRGQRSLAELNRIAPALFEKIRQERGWTMQALAVRLDIGKSYISMIEAGQRPVTPEVLVRLYNILSESQCPNCGQMMIDICPHCGYQPEVNNEP